MWTLDIILLTLAVVAGQGCGAVRLKDQHRARAPLHARDYINATNINESYDYIITGGGLAGLVLASRLSQNPSTTVLVLEAGLSGDAVANQVNTPDGAYYSSIVGTDYDWQHFTVPQPNLDYRVVGWPRGKILGGSSAMNAMYLVRPDQREMDEWQNIIAPQGDTSAASSWGWQNMYGYMKKSENFSAPIPELSSVINITYNASTHGSGGPMQISYPGVMINIVANWTTALNSIGIPPLASPNGGLTMGGFITPSSINPTNWTRSYSRPAYIDSLPPRSNLHILSEATVVRIVLSDSPDSSGNKYARAVEFAANPSAARQTVKVNKEVLVTGGALGSPKILMLSGIGPKDVLANASVPLQIELPGVGQHLQDHLTAGVVWQTPYETAGNLTDSGSDFSHTAQFQSFVNDAVAFVNASLLFNGSPTDFQNVIQAARNTSATTLVPSVYPEVAEGYKAIYDVLVNKFLPETAQLEMLMSVMSSGLVSIQSAIQHPFSQGRVYLNSDNPFDPIIIDPQYYSHFADVVIMRQGIKLVRQMGVAYGPTFGQEISPGPTVQTDDDIDSWLKGGGAGTQFHPMGSCAMLPKSQGGVVDAKLRVYGLANVRVADASVFPFEFAAHLASATYGLAEQAAALIQADSYTVPSSANSLRDIPITSSLLTLCLMVYAIS